jgi:hypothetical protein
MNTTTKFGLIGGVATCIWGMIEHFLGFHGERIELSRYSGHFVGLITVVVLVLALKEQRERKQGGFLSFEEGCKVGLPTMLVLAALTTAFAYVYNFAINPGWTKKAAEWEIAQLQAAKAPEAKIQKTLAAYNAIDTPVGLFLFTFFGTFIRGMVFTVVVAIFTRRVPENSQGVI